METISENNISHIKELTPNIILKEDSIVKTVILKINNIDIQKILVNHGSTDLDLSKIQENLINNLILLDIITLNNKDNTKDNLINMYNTRSKIGIQKYRTTLDRTDLNSQEWGTHLKEELMDASLYLEKLMTFN